MSETVKDWIERLSQFPGHWLVVVATSAGGDIAIEHREINGKPVVAVFGSNGGRFGENPLTEEEYKKKSAQFLSRMCAGYAYTAIHGDDRLYLPLGGGNDTCYGEHYDPRIISRMIEEGLLQQDGSGTSCVVRLASASEETGARP